MNILFNPNELPILDPDFDDLELLYEDDCEDASPEEQALYDFWVDYDERQADKINRRSQS